MLAPFDVLTPNARIWIYQCDRKLEESEIELIRKTTEPFIKSWTAHGKDLQAGFTVLHQQFLILAVDETKNLASGCSIDSSVNFIRDLENELNVSFLDHSKIAMLVNEEIQLISFAEIREKIRTGIINRETQTFNNSISSKEGLDHQWCVRAGDSWIKKYFN